MPADPKPRQCRHLFTDGRQCGSPSLRHEHFCYYHHTTRVPAPRPTRAHQIASGEFLLPMPENRAAIQHALGEVLRRVAAMQIEYKTASLLFYGLSIASANLPRPTSADVIVLPQTEPVQEIVIDEEDGLLAPAFEPIQPIQPGTPVQNNKPIQNQEPVPHLEAGQRLISPGRLRREQRLARERRAIEEMEEIARSQRARAATTRPAAPPNSPELDRLLRLNPPPPHIAIERHFTPAPDKPLPRPQPWQREAVLEVRA
jgi:hypothetical protein